MEHADLYYKLAAVGAVTLAMLYAQLWDGKGRGATEKGPIIGIDLGSAYMSAGLWTDNGVSIIYNSYGRQTTPTVISFHPDGRIYVGDMANSKTVSSTYTTVHHIYAVLGRAWTDPNVQEMAKSKFTGFNIVNHKGKPALEVNETTLYYPEQIFAVFLAHMKDTAEGYLQTDISKAVLTVPAYFNDHQRRAVKNAGKLAGLDVMRTLNAPTAVAVYHSLTLQTSGSRQQDVKDTVVMVIDFGASHLDASILTLADGVVEARGSKGTDTISGDEINKNMANYFLKQYTRKHGTAVEDDVKAMAKLLKEVERVKRQLSYHEVAMLDIEMFHGFNDFSSTLTRDVFEDINQKTWDGIKAVIKSLLYESQYKLSWINEVILTGGSSRIPRVRQLIQKIFSQKKLINIGDPDMLAAYGAAVQGGMLSHVASLNDKLTLDVSTSSLGYKTAHGNISIVIPKYTTLPSGKTINFTTAVNYQESMVATIFEGSDARDNTKWGDLVISGIAPSRKEFPMFEITLKIDERGLYDFQMTNKSVKYTSFVIKPSVRGLKYREIPGLKTNVSRLITDIDRTYKREKYTLNTELYMYFVKRKINHGYPNDPKKKKLNDILASLQGWFSVIESKPLSEIVEKLLNVEKDVNELDMTLS